MRHATLGLWMAPMLMAQAQPTFYAAYQDGLDAERQGQWKAAIAAYRRAIELRPASAGRVVIYGNNLLNNYAPHTRLARCLLESGDVDGAQAALSKAAHYGEPKADRDALHHAISQQTQPAPAPKEPAFVTQPAEPTPKAHPPALPPAAEPAPQPTGKPAEVPALPLTRPEPPPETPIPAQPPRVENPSAAMPAPTPSPQDPKPIRLGPLGPGRLLALGLLGLLGLAVWARSRKKRSWRSLEPRPTSDLGPASKIVGPYRLERLLGRGGFADTYLARHGATGQEVALKLPHPHRVDDEEFRARFRLEARLGALLDHPNLVRILDPGPEDGAPYLAMEYVPGERLDEHLKAQGALPLAEAVGLAYQVAEAMAHAHAHGVVHRDLKPGNILLTPGGAKVMDLGIARVMDADTVTTTYAFLGTPLYAAPEAQLKTHVGPAADRYSLGVILFHMLAGEPPFQGETPFEILDRHRSALPPDLRVLRPDVPGPLRSLVARLLEKDPDLRPDDSEITRVLAGLEVSLSVPPAAPPQG